MRTTIDLPEPILRQIEARTAVDGRDLNELIAEYLVQGLARPAPPTFARAAASGRTIPAFTNAEIAAILDQEDADSHARSARP